MSRASLRGPLSVLVLCVLSLGMAVSALASRTEATLSWDDGAMDSEYHTVTGHPGQRMAVMFQAPEWANWVTEIHYYIADDLSPNPTEPLLAYVWKPAGESPVLPGEAANIGAVSVGGYPKEAWLELVLPQAVDITDSVQFPDRVFFAGMEWLYRINPYLGEDHSDPIDHMSWRFNWVVWELREDADTMIRAVVTDTWTSPVETGNWSRIKATFR